MDANTSRIIGAATHACIRKYGTDLMSDVEYGRVVDSALAAVAFAYTGDLIDIDSFNPSDIGGPPNEKKLLGIIADHLSSNPPEDQPADYDKRVDLIRACS